uniref:Reverse transcriptase domain-containing protein n=1 Tax=Angiostrongylus cantonensis TaxID=6313 RepID=A0A0K0D3J6_ANGCA
MRTLEWVNMGVKIDGWQIHDLRFADDIVFITPDISQAERMLVDFDKACGNIGFRLNLKKTRAVEIFGARRFAPCSAPFDSIRRDMDTPPESLESEAAEPPCHSVQYRWNVNAGAHAALFDKGILYKTLYSSSVNKLTPD